jgi:hypothetical protein
MNEELTILIVRLQRLRETAECRYAKESTADAMGFAEELGAILAVETLSMLTVLKGDVAPFLTKPISRDTMHECFIGQAIHEKHHKRAGE